MENTRETTKKTPAKALFLELEAPQSDGYLGGVLVGSLKDVKHIFVLVLHRHSGSSQQPHIPQGSPLVPTFAPAL